MKTNHSTKISVTHVKALSHLLKMYSQQLSVTLHNVKTSATQLTHNSIWVHTPLLSSKWINRCKAYLILFIAHRPRKIIHLKVCQETLCRSRQ